MASRESQGLQIALIILVMLTVGLAVTTYVYYSRSETLAKEVTAATDKAQGLQNTVALYDFERTALKRMIGVGGVAEADVEELRRGIAGQAQPPGVWAMRGFSDQSRQR